MYGFGELKLLFPKHPEVAVWTLLHLYVAGVAILGLPRSAWPLWETNMAMDNGSIEIVFLIKRGDIPHSYVSLPDGKQT